MHTAMHKQNIPPYKSKHDTIHSGQHFIEWSSLAVKVQPQNVR